jgi:hypothetical protein
MYEVPDSSLPNGTVAKVVQAGYMIGDRMLRRRWSGWPRPGPSRRLPRLRKRCRQAEEPVEELAEHVEASANDDTDEPAPTSWTSRTF